MKKTKLTRSLMAAVSIVALSAVMYGCVHDGEDAPPAIDMDALDAAKSAAAAAAAAAKTASDGAAAAVAAVAGISEYSAVAYLGASDAADDAMAAYAAAKAASATAASAETVAAAEAAQATAEAEKAKAEAALAEATRLAGLVTAAKAAADADAAAAEAERVALAAARTAADAAADAAEMSSASAMAAADGVMDIQASDQASYDAAAAAAADAMAAATAAREASDSANRATTSADAQMYQETAETQQGMAADALADAMMYAGMVTQAKADDDAEAERMRLAAEAAQMLADTKAEAADAATAAMTAANAAAQAVMDVENSAVLDTMRTAAAAFARAEDASEDAATAHLEAVDANLKAQAAMSQEDAANYRDMAVAAQGRAEAAQTAAETFAGIVSNAQMMVDDAATEMQMLADAKMKAGEAATAARTAADAAEAAAMMAEAAAPGSTDARDARAAATAADTAAGLAEAANMAAQAATDSETAMMKQMEAEAQRDIAQNQQMYAENNRDEAEDARLAAEQLQEERDLSDAQQAAEDLYSDTADGIMFHYNAVMSKAGLAAGQATAARNAANQAKAARTDYATADAEAKKAEAASAEAQASLARAMTAKGEADTARQAAMDATTSEAAKMALADLEAANAKLTEEHTGETGAGMDYMAAKAAAEAAMTAAGDHVLMLFMAANGAHVMDVEATDADERAAHVTSVGTAMATIAAVANGAQTAGTTVTITFPGDTVDNPATVDDPATTETVENNEFSEGMLGITVSSIGGGGGPEIVAEFGADRAADTTVTPNVTRRIQTARQIGGIGPNFPLGYELWEDDGDDTATSVGDRARAILFTDKQKGDDSVLEVAAATARTVENVAVSTTTLTKLGTKVGNTYTGAEYTPSGEAVLMGTLTCPPSVTCSVDATTAADGTVTINAVSGYVFTGSRDAVEAVEAADATENNDYLAFGLWLEESDDGTTDTFGAFAVGGTGYAVNVANAVTGTAGYTGKAAGAHHRTGEGVNWFEGDAYLTADFGADDAPGTVHGSIENIELNGGAAMMTPIYLGQAALSDGSAVFNGAAFMGAATAPGAATHEFDGTWSGSFFGATANDTTTTDVDESITAPLAAAGTFGVTKSEGTGDDMVVESFVGAFGAHKN